MVAISSNDKPIASPQFAEGPSPTFYVGSVPIYGDLALAPMSGYSDVPYRVICREYGSAISYTSCILDDAVLAGSPRSEMLIDLRAEERPVAIQMLGKDAASLLRACQRVMALEPDWIDVNLGCPARRVSSGGRGAALMCEPQRIGEIISLLTRTLPVPVTAKIRLGWDDESRNYLEIAHILEDSGIAAIAVHGRTKTQAYSGRADWEAIAEVKRAVRVPVLANGDVRSVADIAAIRHVTACDGVLIGRGAIGNPWIFQRRDLADVQIAERVAMIERHLRAMAEYYGERIGVLLFRKHLVRYVQSTEGATDVRPRLVECETAEAIVDVLAAWQAERHQSATEPSL
jgi:tRNA-dihydrouridine synthase B